VRSTGIDRLAKSRLIIFDLHGVSGRKRDDLLTEILLMVGRKPTGLYHYDLFSHKRSRERVRTKYFISISPFFRLCEMHTCDGGWVLAAILYHIA
jgi:hypothetical protein